MHETSEIRRSPSGAVDTQHYAREAHALRSEAIRDAASGFAGFIKRSFRAMGRRRTTAPEFPTYFSSPAE
jgi:hypothetical protein